MEHAFRGSGAAAVAVRHGLAIHVISLVLGIWWQSTTVVCGVHWLQSGTGSFLNVDETAWSTV